MTAHPQRATSYLYATDATIAYLCTSSELAEVTGSRGRTKRFVVRSFLRAWPNTDLPDAIYATKWNVRRRLESSIREQVKKDFRQEYGFIGITVAFVVLAAIGGAISWLVERILTRLFPSHSGGLDEDACRLFTQWSEDL